jgi:hypothetical protein
VFLPRQSPRVAVRRLMPRARGQARKAEAPGEFEVGSERLHDQVGPRYRGRRAAAPPRHCALLCADAAGPPRESTLHGGMMNLLVFLQSGSPLMLLLGAGGQVPA